MAITTTTLSQQVMVKVKYNISLSVQLIAYFMLPTLKLTIKKLLPSSNLTSTRNMINRHTQPEGSWYLYLTDAFPMLKP